MEKCWNRKNLEATVALCGLFLCLSVTNLQAERLDLVILIDKSGSMVKAGSWGEPNDPNGLAWTACETVLHALGEKDRVAIATFGEQTDWLLNGEFWLAQAERKAILGEIQEAKQRPWEDYTYLGDAMAKMVELLKNAANRPAVLILSDGAPNDKDKQLLPNAVQALTRSQIPAFFVYINHSNRLPSHVSQIFKSNPGFIRELKNPDDLPATFLSILRNAIPEAIQVSRLVSYPGNGGRKVFEASLDPALGVSTIDFFFVNGSGPVIARREPPDGKTAQTTFGAILSYDLGALSKASWKFESAHQDCIAVMRSPKGFAELRFPQEALFQGGDNEFVAVRFGHRKGRGASEYTPIPETGHAITSLEFLDSSGKIVSEARLEAEKGWSTSTETVVGAHHLAVPPAAVRANAVLGTKEDDSLAVRHPIQIVSGENPEVPFEPETISTLRIDGLVPFSVKPLPDEWMLEELEAVVTRVADRETSVVRLPVVLGDKPGGQILDEPGEYQARFLGCAVNTHGERAWLTTTLDVSLPHDLIVFSYAIIPKDEPGFSDHLGPGDSTLKAKLKFAKASFVREWPRIQLASRDAVFIDQETLKPVDGVPPIVRLGSFDNGEATFAVDVPSEAGKYNLRFEVVVSGATLFGNPPPASVLFHKDQAAYVATFLNPRVESWALHEMLPFPKEWRKPRVPIRIYSDNHAEAPKWLKEPTATILDDKFNQVSADSVQVTWEENPAFDSTEEVENRTTWMRTMSLASNEEGTLDLRIDPAEETGETGIVMIVHGGWEFLAWLGGAILVVCSMTAVLVCKCARVTPKKGLDRILYNNSKPMRVGHLKVSQHLFIRAGTLRMVTLLKWPQYCLILFGLPWLFLPWPPFQVAGALLILWGASWLGQSFAKDVWYRNGSLIARIRRQHSHCIKIVLGPEQATQNGENEGYLGILVMTDPNTARLEWNKFELTA